MGQLRDRTYLQVSSVRIPVELKHDFGVVAILDETDVDVVRADDQVVDDCVHERENMTPVLIVLLIDTSRRVDDEYEVEPRADI